MGVWLNRSCVRGINSEARRDYWFEQNGQHILCAVRFFQGSRYDKALAIRSSAFLRFSIEVAKDKRM
jgi:hypothetical protein